MTLQGVAILAGIMVAAGSFGRFLARLLCGCEGRRPEDRFLQTTMGLAALTWWGVVLGEAGQFTPLAWLVPPIVAAIACSIASRAREPNSMPAEVAPEPAPAPAATLPLLPQVMCAAAICALALWHAGPSFDPRVEARDPGVYANAGIQLARTGGIAWIDEAVTSLGPQARAYFFPPPGYTAAQDSWRYLGFFLEDLDTGRVLPQANPVFLVWIAAAHLVLPLSGALSVGSIGFLLGALGLMWLGARYYGPIGLLAGPMLAVCVGQAWFARYSAGEMAAQFFLLSGLLAWVRYREERRAFDALTAGCCLGLVAMTKAEMSLLVPLLAGVLLLDTLTGKWRQRDLWFWIPVAGLTAHTIVHAVGWLWPYYFHLLRQFELMPLQFFSLALAGGLIYAAALAAAGRIARTGRRREVQSAAVTARAREALRWIVAAVIVVGLGYGLWVQPVVSGGDWNALNTVELGLAASPWLVSLGGLGAGLLLVRPPRQRDVIPLLVLVVLSGAILVERNIIPELMWAFRRYVPALFPAVFLFAAGFSALVVRWSYRRMGPVAAGLAAVFLLLPGVSQNYLTSKPYRGHQQYPGGNALVEEIRNAVPPGSVLLFEPRSDRGLMRFEAVLGMGAGLKVFRLPSRDVARDGMQSLLRTAAKQDRRVFLVTTGYLNGLEWPAGRPTHAFRWETTHLRPTWNLGRLPEIGLPEGLERLVFYGRIYELSMDGGPLAALPERVVDGRLRGELDIGLWDDLHLVGTGFYDVEVDWIHNYRWTKEAAQILLPGMPGDAAELSLRTHSNGLLGRQTVEALLDGVPLGTATVPDEMSDVVFRIPDEWEPPAQGIPRLELRTQTAEPSSVGTGDDPRSLGIRLERVFWSKAPPRP